MGWVQPITMPNGTTTKTVGFPIGTSDFAFEITHTPPQLGAHSEEVFDEWTQRRSAQVP
jgi:crotonobetainyl-CoA:carnitine CoA-transferase CaiB-like acyl-CoA transferase